MIRIAVRNENAAEDFRGCIVAIESRDMAQDSSKDTTAALAYDAADLTPKGGATRSGTEIVHSSLTAGWLTILNSEIDGVGHQTHAGIRRLWIRAQDTGTDPGDVEFRLRWRALGSLSWSENPIVPSPLVDAYQYLDMGECRPQPAALGDERWEWELQARAPGGFGGCKVARILPAPTEQYLKVAAPESSQSADLQSQRSPGTMADDDDVGTVRWSMEDNAKTSDGSYATALLNSSASHYLVATNFGFSIPSGALILGIIAEVQKFSSETWSLVDTNARIVKGGVLGDENKKNPYYWPDALSYVAYGGATDLFGETWEYTDINASNFGFAIAAYNNFGSDSTANIDHIRITVYYTEDPDENKVCFATRSAEFRSDGIYRQHFDDDVWGQVTADGFLLYAPPSGLEGRAARCIVIPTQGDFGVIPDSGDNRLSATVSVRPAYLFAREAGS